MPDETQYTRKVHMGGWLMYQSDDGEYLYLERTGKPGRMRFKATDDGLLAELCKDGDERIASSMCAMWSDLQTARGESKRKLPFYG